MRITLDTPNVHQYRVRLDGRLMGFVSAADDEEGWVQTTEANTMT